MSKNLAIAVAAGLVCVAIAVYGIVYMQRGAHLEMPGQFLKVRTAPLDDNAAVAIIDFRVTNRSDYPAVVRLVRVFAEQNNGARLESQTISDVDAKRVFEGIPLLGSKYNPSLLTRDRLPARAVWDRMVAARFEVPENALQARKRLIVSIEEIDGRTFEITEK